MRRWLIPLLVCALTVLSILYWDQKITAFFMPDELYRFRRISRYLTDAGEASFWIVISMCFIFLGWLERTKKSRLVQHLSIWGSTTLYALITSGVALHILKWTFGRQRPHMTPTYDPHVFIGWTQNSHFQSMPSGHSQVFFVIATVLAARFPRQSFLIYILGFFFAMTRVFTTQHFFSDVLVGCLIGHLMTKAILEYRMKKNQAADWILPESTSKGSSRTNEV